MNDLEELIVAIGKIVLGVVVLMGGLITLDLVVYLSVTSSTLSEKVLAAYDGGYDNGYAQTYEVAYQEGHDKAYYKGYYKAYQIGPRSDSNREVATRAELYNPTYKEMKEFLADDETDSNPFIKGEYVCFDYSADVNNSAEANGIRAAYVRIRFEEWGHAVVAFQTVDQGLIFIEPQTDKAVELVIGEPYPWQATGANRSSNYDDVIVEIQIIW